MLSGFLITSLLIAEWRRSGTIALGAFWARRARRLLPALFWLVAVVGLYTPSRARWMRSPASRATDSRPCSMPATGIRSPPARNYFAATGPVSPLKHTWSLAIEEQFYMFWPVLLMA